MRRLLRRAALYRHGRAALWIAGGYAVAVGGVSGWVIYTYYVSNSLAAVWLFLVTAPISIPLIFVLQSTERFGTPLSPLWLLMFTAGGLLQAWLLWLACRSELRDPAT